MRWCAACLATECAKPLMADYGGKATVPTAPAPVRSERGGTRRVDPAVDTHATTPAPDAGQHRQWPPPPPAFVHSPVPVPPGSTSGAASRGPPVLPGRPASPRMDGEALSIDLL